MIYSTFTSHFYTQSWRKHPRLEHTKGNTFRVKKYRNGVGEGEQSVIKIREGDSILTIYLLCVKLKEIYKCKHFLDSTIFKLVIMTSVYIDSYICNVST